MSDFATVLAQEAMRGSNEFQGRRLGLEKELDAAKLRVIEVEASLHETRLAIERVYDFKPTLGGEFQCPICWIRSGVRAPIIPQSSETDADHFRCREGHEYSF
jgi:hypothetical protein